uniref:Malate dehydrogenase n=1 Tax=Panagrolaimus sp. PS1159 TaxID=55785 RepID=A0AC35FWS7_9BILA
MEAASERGFDYHYVVEEKVMHDFIVKSIVKAGAEKFQGESVARMLIYADSRGHFSHGINRLSLYIHDLQTNTCNRNGKPKILKQKGSTALIDGDNALGSVVGEFAIDLAISLAKEHGVGWVTANNSNHFGAAGRYGHLAADAGLIGFAMTNTSPLVFPTRSSQKALGTNPLACVAPAENGDHFALDMAISTVSLGKVEVANRKEKEEVPHGWGANSKGIEEQNPKIILDKGGLLPLGGIEVRGGYKGSGLGMMVDILCGVMSGAHFGKNVRAWAQVGHDKADLGQCYIAVDPKCFADGFTNNLKQFLDQMRSLEPTDPKVPVRVPGDFSKSHGALIQHSGGLVYHKSQIEQLEKLAKEVDIPFFETKPFEKL